MRMGPWARGRKANKEDLAIGFYSGGLTLKEYSTLDIASSEDNVWTSVSHYRVFDKILGFRIEGGDDAILDNEYFVFEAETIDGRKLVFNVRSGAIQTTQSPVEKSFKDKFEQINAGMTREEVRKLLGVPNRTSDAIVPDGPF
ncbi:MAG: hypothetical protein ABIJ41_07800 [Candidatus Omnitrophota bacterium]